MQASTIRIALLGVAAAILAGCATGERTSVAWERQSIIDQHRFMPAPSQYSDPPLVVFKAGPAGTAIAMNDTAAPATQVVTQGDRILLVTQQEYARLQGSNPQVLGAPAQPAAPATTPPTK